MSKKLFAYFLLTSLSFFALQVYTRQALATYQVEYKIKIQADGSAFWEIRQIGIGLHYSFDEFVSKVHTIVELAEKATNRTMNADDLSMRLNVTGSYKTVTYLFCWMNFCEVEDNRLMIGDVFKIENFFGYLYGDGAVYINYPQNYVVKSVSPQPHNWDSNINILEWYGIQDFDIGEPEILLEEKSAAYQPFTDSILILGIFCSIIVVAIGVYYVRRRKESKTRPEELQITESFAVKDDEQKIIDVLRASGGILYQSKISDICGFSRAKTSKLLKIMEEKGKIKRKVKGREKIVTLLEKNKVDP